MNKTALVTGAGVGIGRGIALELAGNGYDVAVHCRGSRDKAEEVRREIRRMGRKSEILQVDLSDERGPFRLMEEFAEKFDSLDLFVANSGVTRTAPFLETTVELFNQVCFLDLRGSYFCIQQAARYFIEKKIRGNIVVISSNNDRLHSANASVYGSVKAGLSKAAEHAAAELAAYGIRVNVIAPGWTDTGETRMGRKEDTYYKIPLKRWCTPEEIGRTVVFLDSDGAASITGSRLVMDGGALLLSDRSEKYGL